MAELEIHHETEGHDPFGQKVGVLAAILAVGLAIVTIASHRAHTEAVILKAEVNDQWSLYQSKRLKFHNLELGEDLLKLLGPHNDEVAKALDRYAKDKKEYDKQGKEVQAEAKNKETESRDVEARALRYDVGEGMLEIGLVLSSLYFISHKKFFPAIGIAAGLLGALIAASGLLMH